MIDLQEQALAVKQPIRMNSLEQSDAEEALAEWMESANIENAWKMAPTLVSIGVTATELERMKNDFDGPLLGEALGWLEAMASSMQLVGTIEESIGRVTDLVHAVKSYAYEGKGQKQTIDINNSIHATLIILGHKLREKEIVLEKNFATDLPPLHSECTGLNQIWTNLLDNAIKYTPQSGSVDIAASLRDTDVVIDIRDSGIGIPPEDLGKIWDRFFRGDKSRTKRGLGLGLSLAKAVILAHKGAIKVFSDPGKGTHVSIQFASRCASPESLVPQANLSKM